MTTQARDSTTDRFLDLASALGTTSPLAKRVIDELFAEIVTAKRVPGDVLTELQIAQETGVSRTPAREALLQLEAVGLVRLMPKKGAVVTTISDDQARDLLAVRAMFEAAAVRQLEVHQDRAPALKADLERQLEAQHAALSEGDLLAFAAADFAFHARIISEARNTVVSETFVGLGPRLARLTYRAVSGGPASLESMHADHRELIELACAGRAVEYEQALQSHIRTAHVGL